MHLRVAAERLGERYAVPVTTRPPIGRLSRDHPQADLDPRPAQEAVRRPRPVRRRGAGDQAAAARLRLQVRGQDHRRRGAAQLHPVGGGGRHRRAQARAARLPGGRSRTWRWSTARITRSNSSDMAFRTAGRIGIVEGLPQCQPVLLEPIHHGRDRLPERGDREDERHPVGPARPDPRLRHARGLERLGRGARADGGSRRSATSSSRCARPPPASAASPSSSTTWPS